MISVQSVDDHLRRLAQPVDGVVLPLSEAAGRCLREALVARRPAPPFDRVMMDGFAIRVAGVAPEPQTFRICGSAPAGSEPPKLQDETCAVEVMTGAMLPPGADCVVPVEDCRVEGETLEIEAGATRRVGQFIHRCGSEYAVGKEILPAGVRLHPAHVALAASEGYAELRVNRDLRVHLITTGDEIVEAGRTPLTWQIFGTHAPAIRAAFSTAPDVRFRHLHLRDDLARLVAAIDAVREEADVIILCGAMSKGRKDNGIEAVQQCGFEMVFHRVAQRPGHPMALAHRGRTLLFGLPGNPLAVLFTLYRHVLPAVDRLRGYAPPRPTPVVIGNHDLSLPGATRFIPCRFLEGCPVPVIPHNSGDLECLANTDGFLELPPLNRSPEESDAVNFWPWS